MKKNFSACRDQDSNLRSQRETDFESVALTTRPRLLQDGAWVQKNVLLYWSPGSSVGRALGF